MHGPGATGAPGMGMMGAGYPMGGTGMGMPMAQQPGMLGAAPGYPGQPAQTSIMPGGVQVGMAGPGAAPGYPPAGGMGMGQPGYPGVSWQCG